MRADRPVPEPEAGKVFADRFVPNAGVDPADRV